MPMVATGVPIFMSPVCATLPATKDSPPSTRLNKARVRRRIRVVRIVAQRHARIGDEIDRAAVGEGDAGGRIGAGLHHVALVDRVADIERDGVAVANDRDFADDFLDAADRLGRRDRPGLRIFVGRAEPASRSTRSGDSIAPFGATSAGRMLAREIAGNDVVVAVVAGQNEIGTGAMKMRGEQQLRVGNDNIFGWAESGLITESKGPSLPFPTNSTAIPRSPRSATKSY